MLCDTGQAIHFSGLWFAPRSYREKAAGEKGMQEALRIFPVLGFPDDKGKPGSQHLGNVGSWGRKSFPLSGSLRFCDSKMEMFCLYGEGNEKWEHLSKGTLEPSGSAPDK